MTLNGSQSTFRQQFVRVGGALDLKSGTPISGGGSTSSSSSGSQLPGQGNMYRPHTYQYGEDNLYFSTDVAFYRDGEWNWTVKYDARGTWKAVVLNEQRELQTTFTLEGLFQYVLLQYRSNVAAPQWYITHASLPNLTPLQDQKGLTYFNYTPYTDQ